MSTKGRFFSLYKFELLKILKNKVAMVTFAIFFAMAFIQGEGEIAGNIEPEELKYYSEFNGRLLDEEFLAETMSYTDELGDFTLEDHRAYLDIRNWIRDIVGYRTRFTEFTPADIYDIRLSEIDTGMEEEKLTEGEKQFWQQKASTVSTPFTFYSNWIPAGVLEGTTNFSIYLIVLVSTSLAMIFSMETQRKTDAMIRATINGTDRLYFAKILAGVTYILACITVIVVGFLTYIGLRWGFSGMQSAVQLYWPLANENMTLWKLEGVILIMLIAFALLLAAFSLLMSNVTRNGIATMALVIGVSLGIFALSTMVPLEKRLLNQAIQWISPSVISSRLVYEYRLVHLGKYFTVYEFVPILYVFLSIVMILAGFLVYKKHEIKNN
ncbi:MAG: hypothetical protein J6X36_07785 [Lachnospiraceae bacterium]|nr:hypothetical protein [Lachnospiraceae bacterium]